MGLLEGVKETIQRSRRWSLDKVRKKKRKEREKKNKDIWSKGCGAENPKYISKATGKNRKEYIPKKMEEGHQREHC